MSPPKVNAADAIPDDEIICADETGRPIFIEMLRGRHPVCFVAFDLLWLNGEDLRPLPLVERKARLRRLLRRRSNHLIAQAMAVDGRGRELMAAVEAHDLKGIVAKRKRDPYRRGVTWWKIKNPAYSQAEGATSSSMVPGGQGRQQPAGKRAPRRSWQTGLSGRSADLTASRSRHSDVVAWTPRHEEHPTRAASLVLTWIKTGDFDPLNEAPRSCVHWRAGRFA